VLEKITKHELHIAEMLHSRQYLEHVWDCSGKYNFLSQKELFRRKKKSILSFSQKCVLTIFRIQNALLEFFFQICQLFVWHNFLGILSTFYPY
jgi:hypothetical protein